MISGTVFVNSHIAYSRLKYRHSITCFFFVHENIKFNHSFISPSNMILRYYFVQYTRTRKNESMIYNEYVVGGITMFDMFYL